MLRFQVRVLRTIFSNPVMFCSGMAAPKPLEVGNPNSLPKKLSDEFGDIGPIKETLKNDEVKNVYFGEWCDRIYVMKKYRFTNLQCFQMIAQYPLLLKIPLPDFKKTIGQWFFADLGLNHFQEILLSQPVLFEVDADVIRKRLPQFRTFFRNSGGLAELLINCPNIMYDNSDTVLEKFRFLLSERSFTMGDISKSGALSVPLDVIKFRLDLLEKCGVYKREKLPPHKINKNDKSRHINPQLKDILDSSTKKFAKLAKISQEEYVMCRDLFMENENDEDEPDDEIPYVKNKKEF